MEIESIENNKPTGFMKKNSDMLFIFALFGIISLLVLPVPTIMLDLLLAMSIAISLLILIIVVYVRDPSEFSIFPTILLAITLFRLGLNIASTRLILLDGFAGNVIEAFGSFVVRGNFIVGAVVFLILVIINFTVITKGAGRIAEVTARFTLDAMPGKQMSIDAELNAGIIDEATAIKRREKIQKDADFYGAMDGASKFVRGDAMAGVLITGVNVIGGIAIGMIQRDMGLTQALEKFTLLSIGDGLVSQIPAIIISVSAALLVTRTAEGTDLSSHMQKQVTHYPRAIGACGLILATLAIVPGFPTAPFLLLGSGMGVIAYVLKKKGIGLVHDEEEESTQPQLTDGSSSMIDDEVEAKPGSTADLCNMIKTDTFAIELGYGLLTLADKQSGGDLLERITGVRQKFAREMGIIMPPIAVRDNLELETSEYRFLIRNKEVGKSSLVPNRWLAMNVSNSTVELKGIPTVEPVFNLDAVWITDDERKNAEINGYTVVDASSVMITHLSETIKENSDLIVEREDVQRIIEVVKETNPTLIEELLPDMLNVGVIQRVLQNLLKERISIKNITVILETLSDIAQFTKNPDELSEQVRKRLGTYFIEPLESEPGFVQAITLDPRLEQILTTRVKRTQFEIGLMMDPKLTEHLLNELTPRLSSMLDQGYEPIVITTTELRLAFKKFFEPSFPRMTVLAFQEIPNSTQIRNFGIITNPPEGSFIPTPVVNEQPEAAPAPATV